MGRLRVAIASLPWFAVIVLIGVIVATSYFSARVTSQNDHAQAILDSLGADKSTADAVTRVLNVGIGLSWGVVLVAACGARAWSRATLFRNPRSRAPCIGRRRATAHGENVRHADGVSRPALNP